MALKILGQVSPNATTNTTLYTVPAASSAVISSLFIANPNLSDTTIRIAVRPSGEAIATKHYIAYDKTIGGNNSQSLVLGLSLAATDIVTVYAATSNVTFNIFGSEN